MPTAALHCPAVLQVGCTLLADCKVGLGVDRVWMSIAAVGLRTGIHHASRSLAGVHTATPLPLLLQKCRSALWLQELIDTKNPATNKSMAFGTYCGMPSMVGTP